MADRALVMHLSLPEGKVADVNILNIFSQGEGDEIEFPDDGFSVTEPIVIVLVPTMFFLAIVKPF